MVLFDAISDFLGILEVATVILIIKEAIGVFTGKGGDMLQIKNPFGAGRAEEVKEENDLRKADAEARAAQKGEAQEQKQVQMMTAALARLDQFKNYERTQLTWLKRYINDAIQILSRYQGRLDAAAYQQLSAVIGRIMPSPAQLKAETDQMRTIVAYLEKAEVVEANQALRVLARVYNDMRNKINKTAAKTPAAQAKKKKMLNDLLNVRRNLNKDIMDVRTQLVNQMQRTKSQLEPNINLMENVEQQLSKIVTDVVEEIKLGNTKQAIGYLKSANALVDKLAMLINTMEREENAIKQEISRRFRDINDEKKLMQRMDLELRALTATP